MTRRRLTVALLAAAALGSAWWLLSTGLSAEEEQLVGTWLHDDGLSRTRPGGLTAVWDLGRNGEFRFRLVDRATGDVLRSADGRDQEHHGRWFVDDDGAVNFDWEDRPFARFRRTLPPNVPGSLRYRLETLPIESVTAEEAVLRRR